MLMYPVYVQKPKSEVTTKQNIPDLRIWTIYSQLWTEEESVLACN